jgi:peptidoglycan/LPS O-acetylase OafA/YrhL
VSNNPEANFYLLHSRIWELFAGSIVAFVLWKRNIKSSNVFSILGMAAIFFSFFFYDQFTPFPSVFTLVPIIGVMLIILYGNKGTVVAKLLGNKIFVNIGIASYSIYLWHVPLQIYSSYMISNQIIQLIFYFFIIINAFLVFISICRNAIQKEHFNQSIVDHFFNRG